MIIDKVFYNDFVKKNPSSNNFRESFVKGMNRRNIKKALCNINSLREKYNIYEEGLINNVLFYLFLALNECEFTDIQRERLEMWVDGYTENDIANKFNVSRWVVSKSINASCDKIIEFLNSEVI